MIRNRALPFLGECYSDEARPFSSQDVCNWLPAAAEKPGTLTPEMAQTPPGLAPFVEIPGQTTEAGYIPSKPVRGTYNCEGKLFAVIGNQLYRITNTGVAIPVGTIPGVTRIRFAHNQITSGNQLVTVNGSAGYVYDTPTDTFERITDPGYPGAITADFVDGYIVGIEPGRRFAFNSDLANAREYNTLDRFTSEYKPDLLVTQVVSNNELILLSQSSGEVFYNSGASQQPFRTKRVFFDKGCSGRCNAAVIDNSFVFHSSDGMFYLYEGGVPKRISTRPIEQAVAGLNWAQGFAEAWIDGGHSVVYWTFPGGHTWGWDASSGKWHRRASYGMDRWRMNTLTKWTRSAPGKRDEWIAGDFQTGRLWRVDWDYLLEGDQEFVSEIVGVVLSDNQNPLVMPRMEVMLDTGQELTVPREFPVQPDPPTITGSAPDGAVGSPYSAFPYTLANGTPPYTVTKRSGAFPANLGPISSAGVIPAVTPNATGIGTVTLRNTDASGLYAEHTDTIQISAMMTALGKQGGGAPDNTRFYIDSGNGIDWNAVSVATGSPGLGLGYIVAGPDRWVAWSQQNCAYRLYGTAIWVAGTGDMGNTGGGHRGCYWDGAYWMSPGQALEIRKSTDGVAFATISGGPVSNCLIGVGDTLVSGSLYSLSSATYTVAGGWLTGGIIFSPSIGPAGDLCMTTDGTHVLCGSGNAGTPCLAQSADKGATWSLITLPTFATATKILCMAYKPNVGALGGIWVAGLDSGEIAFSTNRTTWQLATDAMAYSCTDVAHNGVVFTMLSNYSATQGLGEIRYSANGDDWTVAPTLVNFGGLCLAAQA